MVDELGRGKVNFFFFFSWTSHAWQRKNKFKNAWKLSFCGINFHHRNKFLPVTFSNTLFFSIQTIKNYSNFSFIFFFLLNLCFICFLCFSGFIFFVEMKNNLCTFSFEHKKIHEKYSTLPTTHSAFSLQLKIHLITFYFFFFTSATHLMILVFDYLFIST